MRIRVLFFARLKELAGAGSLELEVPEGTTLGGLWTRLQGDCPALQAFRHPPLMARNLEFASPETLLAGDEEVAFLPPVSGG